MAVLELDKNRGRFRGKNPDPDKNSEQKTSLILWLLIQKPTTPRNAALFFLLSKTMK